MPENSPGKGNQTFQPPITPDVKKGLRELEDFKKQIKIKQDQKKGK